MAYRGVPSSASDCARPRVLAGRLHRRLERARASIGARGQSLVEFALVLPIMLLLALTALDFGRIYLGWINLQTMARAASNFAANNPEAWLTNNTAKITEYRNQVLNDAAASNCVLTPTVPADPTFQDGNGDGTTTGIGDRATAAFTCTFTLITPIISDIVGQTVPVSASAVFPVKNGQFATGGTSGPAANFIASPTTTTIGTNIGFTDLSTGSPTTWLWDFGDGATSTDQHPIHPYAALGTYTVTLSVTSASGSSTFDRTNYITITSGAPVADFTANDTTPAVSQAVSFMDTSSGSPTGWAWTFGDGGSSTTGPQVSHAYNTAGTYTVTLTVTTASGNATVTKLDYIVVAVAQCTVPDFVGLGTKFNKAQDLWGTGGGGAGFTTTVQKAAGSPSGNGWPITSQSIVGGTQVACSSSISVNG